MEEVHWQLPLSSKTNAQDIVDSILSHAVQAGVSDIHIEPMDHCVRIRFRFDGVLFQAGELPIHMLEKITARVKIMSSLDIANKRLPQDGRMIWQTNGRSIDLRVSTMPTVRGEKTVIRLLDANRVHLDLDALGLGERVVPMLRQLSRNSKGLLLISGPTNSGKTTTLYAMLRELLSPAVSIATMEDPVEYQLQGVSQSQINPKGGLLFHNGLRALLRQDPDILVIGEIRDRETAEIAVRAALTGHLVFSTLHTSSAVEAPIRLADMGIEKYLLSEALVGIISQRLVRKLCRYCRVPAAEEQMQGRYRYVGCTKCLHTGYIGRICLCEVVPVGRHMRKQIRNSDNADVLRDAAKADGAWFMKQSIEEALAKGMTDWAEIQRMYDK
ncbi:GspE/PulE family protein [Megasphaera paucivorans]|uniref:General secretion pathway protein E n=1 Tax=Megasphaera paucivorans TaxID=349095 RepID=A0A1G9UJ06_9FIRM|nr:GspE/PulE family protein [Megasphaera paucivorans]SDM59525.1 general secretion pathway protein E [Megasphaera paucivorans]